MVAVKMKKTINNPPPMEEERTSKREVDGVT